MLAKGSWYTGVGRVVKGQIESGGKQGREGQWVDQLGVGIGTGLGDLARSNPLVGLTWATWSYISNFAGTNPSSPIEKTAVQHRIRGINAPCCDLCCRQPQPCSGLPVPEQVRIGLMEYPSVIMGPLQLVCQGSPSLPLVKDTGANPRCSLLLHRLAASLAEVNEATIPLLLTGN